MRDIRVTKICERCGDEFKCSPSHVPFRKNCSRICSAQNGQTNTGRTHFKKGMIPWNKGLKYSTGKNWTNEWKERFIRKRTGHVVTENTRKKISAFQQGVDLNEWKGYNSPLLKKLRRSAKFAIWRNAVLLRDNFTCQNPNCGFCNNKIGIMLHAHHIKHFAKYPDLRFNINNGITYCAEYHLKSNLHLIIMKGGNNIMENKIIINSI